jgi:uncharacterized membrane protein
LKIDGRRRVSLAIAIVAFVGPALGVSAEQPQGSLASPASANRIETQVFDNYALSGPTSRRLSNVDALSCFASCRADGQCAALTYVKWSRECLLKRASGEFRFEPNSLSAVTASAAPPTAMTGPIEMECNAGVSFMAKETDSLTDISIENCEKVCERDASCVGFVHASSQRLCKLFKTIDWISPQAGVVGGVKRQEATDGSVQNISCEELTAVEKENYNQARGDREKLLGYIRTCRICADAEQAKAGIAWFDAKKAEADAEASKLAKMFTFEVCNKTSVKTLVSAAGKLDPDRGEWTVAGWWTISPGSCEEIGQFARGQFYYMAVNGADNRIGWRGQKKLCVSRNTFTRINRGGSCAPDEPLEGFYDRDVEDAKLTWTLNP